MQTGAGDPNTRAVASPGRAVGAVPNLGREPHAATPHAVPQLVRNVPTPIVAVRQVWARVAGAPALSPGQRREAVARVNGMRNGDGSPKSQKTQENQQSQKSQKTWPGAVLGKTPVGYMTGKLSR